MAEPCCKGHAIANFFIIVGTFFSFASGILVICTLTQNITAKTISIVAWGIFLSMLMHIIMARGNIITRWLANILFVINVLFFVIAGAFIALATKTQNLSYFVQAKGALIKKILYEDHTFQNTIIPMPQLIYYHGKLLTNLIIQAQQEKPLKLANVFNYQVLYQDPKELHVRFNEMFIQNTYYFKAATEEPLIIDGGSNIGMSIFYFKKLYPKAKIISFEPEKTIHQILTQNLNANNLKDITLVDKALSDKEEIIQFYAQPSGSTLSSSIFKYDPTLTAYPVQCVKLSSYITQPVDLLKLDIVGAETKVIQELAQANKLSLIKEMIIKYYHHFDEGKDYLSLTLKTLEDNSFGYMIKGQMVHQPLEKGTTQKFVIYAYKK